MKLLKTLALLAALAALALLWRPVPEAPPASRIASPVPSATAPAADGTRDPAADLFPVSPPRARRQQTVDTAQSLEQRLELLLSQDRFQDAVDLYDRQHGRIDEAAQQRQREVILRFADSAARNGELDRAADLLEIYTGLFFKDVEALSLLAEVLRRDARHAAEIEVLYAALNEAHLDADLWRLRRRLDHAVALEAARIEQQQGRQAVIRFYRTLLQGEPLHGPYQIALARAYIGNDDRAARDLLDRISDPTLLDQAADLRRRLDARTAGPDGIATRVPLQQIAGGYAVPVILNGRTRATLLIDTGASLTIISPAVLRRAGMSPERSERQGRFNTVNGVVIAPVTRLRTLALSGEVVEGLDVGAIALPGVPGIDGLLGMNFLRRFEFSLSETEQLLSLTPLLPQQPR